MPKLIIIADDGRRKEVSLKKNTFSIGRKRDNDLVLEDPSVSGHHCRIFKNAGFYCLVDLASKNGTKLNDNDLDQDILVDGDAILVARIKISFEDPAPNPKRKKKLKQKPVSESITLTAPPDSLPPMKTPGTKADSEKPGEEPTFSSGHYPASDKHILIVDDDQGILDLLWHTVKREGFQAGMASDGEKALQRIEKKPPDLAILDIMMPGKNGFDIAKEMQKGPAKNIPIIMVSGQPFDKRILELMEREPNIKGGFEKPVDPVRLLSVIHRTLKTHPCGDQWKKERTGFDIL